PLPTRRSSDLSGSPFMKTLISQLSWNEVFRKLRRHGPRSPVRRTRRTQAPGLHFVRLDDRLAPGSLLSTAASQALLMSGATAWLNLTRSDLAAVAADGEPDSLIPTADEPSDGSTSGI